MLRLSVQSRRLTTQATATPARLEPGARLPLRVGFAGASGLALLGPAVEALAIGRGAALPPGLDALVLDARPAGLDRDSLARLAAAAREAGAPIVGLWDGRGEPAWAGLADVAAGPPGAPAEAEVALAPPADPGVFNPRQGFRDLDAAGFAAIVPELGERVAEGLALLASLARQEPVLALLGRGARKLPLPPGVQAGALPERPQAALRRLSPRLGVVDHPGFHAGEFERAGWIARLSAAGVPLVVAEPTDTLAALLGEELSALLAPVGVRDLEDLDRRERLSVRARRVALRDHSLVAAWRRICEAAGIELPGGPLVSIILATRREDWLEHAMAQVRRQTYEPRELIVALHGDAFAAGIEERVRSLAGPEEPRIVRPASDLVLGEALNAAVEVAGGELITKWDDDDYYDRDHIWDLVLALEYSGADLVGKGAEFVYLEWVNLTIRRFMGDSESDHPRLAGGALMARARALRRIGGWPARRTGEDTFLVKNMKQAGHRTYRTHGFGYILNRHGRDHTWNTNVDYFLVQSQKEWRGLRLDEAGIA